jgi:hypothetical protein
MVIVGFVALVAAGALLWLLLHATQALPAPP